MNSQGFVFPIRWRTWKPMSHPPELRVMLDCATHDGKGFRNLVLAFVCFSEIRHRWFRVQANQIIQTNQYLAAKTTHQLEIDDVTWYNPFVMRQGQYMGVPERFVAMERKYAKTPEEWENGLIGGQDP